MRKAPGGACAARGWTKAKAPGGPAAGAGGTARTAANGAGGGAAAGAASGAAAAGGGAAEATVLISLLRNPARVAVTGAQSVCVADSV